MEQERSQMNPKDQWDLSTLYESDEAWEQDLVKWDGDAQAVQYGQQPRPAQHAAGEGLGQHILGHAADGGPGQSHAQHRAAPAQGIGQGPHQAHRQAEAAHGP